MHLTPMTIVRAFAWSSALVFGASLSACADSHLHPWIPSQTDELKKDEDDDGSTDPCLTFWIYMVDGDSFTSVGGGQMQVHGTETVDMPMAVKPEHYDWRALGKLHLDKYKGWVGLLWDDELVQELNFGKKFIVEYQTQVLVYEDAEDRVELHLFSRPECSDPPADTLTRAEVAALEG